jgi:hypothetical protein
LAEGIDRFDRQPAESLVSREGRQANQDAHNDSVRSGQVPVAGALEARARRRPSFALKKTTAADVPEAQYRCLHESDRLVTPARFAAGLMKVE